MLPASLESCAFDDFGEAYTDGIFGDANEVEVVVQEGIYGVYDCLGVFFLVDAL